MNHHEFCQTDQHAIAYELAAIDLGMPELQNYTEINEVDARKLEADFAPDREYLSRLGFAPETDLCLSDQWKWGTNTNLQEAIPDIHQKLVSQLLASGRPDLANFVRSIDLSPKD